MLPGGVPRPQLRAPHFSPGCQTDPTNGLDKTTAAAQFKEWWDALPSKDIVIFSDGSEQHKHGVCGVGYSYVVYQNRRQVDCGYSAICAMSHVFDAEAIGAWKGLQCTMRKAQLEKQRIHMCIDSTLVIWCMRGNASYSSQWAFYNCQDAMQSHNIKIK